MLSQLYTGVGWGKMRGEQNFPTLTAKVVVSLAAVFFLGGGGGGVGEGTSQDMAAKETRRLCVNQALETK